MKRILYLSYDGMTDPLGQSQVLPYLTGLAPLGYHFTLVSCEKPGRFAENRSIIDNIAKAAGISWHPLPYTKNPPVVSTIADVRRMRALCEKLHREEPFDMVHCRGHVPALVGLHLKRKFGIRFLFDMRGFWADEKVDAGAWKLSNPVFKTIYHYFKRKEKAFLEESDQVVCLTHKAYDEMQLWRSVNLDIKKVTVIPCCVDTAHFNQLVIDAGKKLQLRQELGIDEGDTIVTYLGSIGTWYMLDEMLDFFVAFRKKQPAAKFLFITQDEHERIRGTAAAKGIAAKEIIIRPGKRAEVPTLLSLSSFSLFFIRPSYSKMSSSPTKQGEIMAMGIPVICNAGIGDTDRIVEQYCSGSLVKAMNNTAYEEAIDQFLSADFDRSCIRDGALDFFSLEKGVAQYAAIYEKALQPAPVAAAY